MTESEEVQEKNHLFNIITACKKLGLTTTVDDFGAGFCGLNLIAEFQPDYIKIDRALIDRVDQTPAKQAIIQGVLLTCKIMNISVLAEGVERREEFEWLYSKRVDLFQGYYFARPRFEQLQEVADSLF